MVCKRKFMSKVIKSNVLYTNINSNVLANSFGGTYKLFSFSGRALHRVAWVLRSVYTIILITTINKTEVI